MTERGTTFARSAPVIGISLPVSDGDALLDRRVLCDVAQRADTHGFGNLSTGDHLLWHTAILDTFVSASTVAAVTSRSSVMTGVAIAPLRHPMWTVKMANSIAHLSNGRFVLGLGAGGEVAEEFAAVGVELRQRAALVDEATTLARRYLGAGVEPRTDGLSLGPPLSRRVPIWLAGRAPSALRRVVDWADGWLGLFQPVETFRQVAGDLRERADASESRNSRLACGIQLFVCVDDSVPRGRDRTRAFVERHFGRLDARLESHFVVGPPDHVADVVESYAEAGADFIQFHLTGGGYLEALDELAESLGPRLPTPTLLDLTTEGAAPGSGDAT